MEIVHAVSWGREEDLGDFVARVLVMINIKSSHRMRLHIAACCANRLRWFRWALGQATGNPRPLRTLSLEFDELEEFALTNELIHDFVSQVRVETIEIRVRASAQTQMDFLIYMLQDTCLRVPLVRSSYIRDPLAVDFSPFLVASSQSNAIQRMEIDLGTAKTHPSLQFLIDLLPTTRWQALRIEARFTEHTMLQLMQALQHTPNANELSLAGSVLTEQSGRILADMLPVTVHCLCLDNCIDMMSNSGGLLMRIFTRLPLLEITSLSLIGFDFPSHATATLCRNWAGLSTLCLLDVRLDESTSSVLQALRLTNTNRGAMLKLDLIGSEETIRELSLLLCSEQCTLRRICISQEDTTPLTVYRDHLLPALKHINSRHLCDLHIIEDSTLETNEEWMRVKLCIESTFIARNLIALLSARLIYRIAMSTTVKRLPAELIRACAVMLA